MCVATTYPFNMKMSNCGTVSSFHIINMKKSIKSIVLNDSHLIETKLNYSEEEKKRERKRGENNQYNILEKRVGLLLTCFPSTKG